jgi:hypothetical protein
MLNFSFDRIFRIYFIFITFLMKVMKPNAAYRREEKKYVILLFNDYMKPLCKQFLETKYSFSPQAI